MQHISSTVELPGPELEVRVTFLGWGYLGIREGCRLEGVTKVPGKLVPVQGLVYISNKGLPEVTHLTPRDVKVKAKNNQ